ncbi:DNA internalization-related competence protein ComEC/Rec2 [Paenibacillus tarimensis]|uniref:DNA internalization-related competence protein ComEC/Rec2 n=1 Tax=Paenibacillus tarimensis TaxID=416012 RepID=UPI001F300774|nr:DNA internalization-related competence protein ComEC/Rec2 [Paenibacillus tarimensis]MCF2942021.1 DNA internalization-related competence protein ComEC/Rec2 [Paenibacillus tarimensis]
MPELNRRPIIWFTVCYVGGSSAAAALDMRGLLLAGAALLLWLLALLAVGRLSRPLAAACLAAFALAAGERLWADARNVTGLGLWTEAAEAGAPPEAAVEATIVSAVRIDGDRVSFRAAVHSARVRGEAPLGLRERMQVTVRLSEEPDLAVAARWKRGDRVSLAGRLERPAQASNIGGFDYRRYLYSQRIHWLLQVKGAAGVRITGREQLSTAALMAHVDTAREWLGSRMDRLFPDEQSGYMKGLVLGIRDDLDPERFRQFAELGLTHILAISGLHVAVFLGGLGWVLRRLRVTRELMYSVLIAAVPLYVVMAGAEPSVMRAGIMAVIGLAAAKYHLLKDGLHVLAAAALLMLAWNPYYLTEISFQLSFTVTAGLILGVPRVRSLMPKGGRFGPLMDLAAVSLVAQAVSFPLSIYYFNQFHLLSLPANMLLVPFISMLVLPLGSAAMLLSLIWFPAGKAAAWLAEWANYATYALGGLLEKGRLLRLIWPTPPVWWIALWYAALILLFNLLARQGGRYPPGPGAFYGRGPTLIPVLLLVCLAVYGYTPDRFQQAAIVSFLDVGQGDAVLVRTPAGRHYLIDGGGTVSFRRPGEEWRKRHDPYEVGKDTVVPLLMKRGVHTLDAVIVSHLDTDHIGGLQAVLDTIPVRMLIWNGTVKESPDASKLLETAVRRNIPVAAAHRLLPGYQTDDDSSIRFLWPDRHVWNELAGDSSAIDTKLLLLPEAPDQNELSVSLLWKLYDRTFLFAGDSGSVSEEAIIAAERRDSAGPNLLTAGESKVNSVDVMKLSHHGSKHSNSAAWLAYWQPGEAVVSVGRNNFYGHPHPNVIERVTDAGAALRRTDKQGEIQYKITRGSIEIRTALKGASGGS